MPMNHTAGAASDAVVADNRLLVGVDIGKHFHQAAVIDAAGRMIGGSIRFANTIGGAETLLTRIASVNQTNLPVVFGLEATGHYWLALYSFLTGKGFPVSVINPYQSDAWRKVYLSSVKTDKEDAFLIAGILRFGSFSETKMADEDMISLRNLSRFRIQLTQQLTDTKRRIITVMDTVFPEFEGLFSNMFGKTARELLKNYPLPADPAGVGLTKLSNLLIRLSKGHFQKDKAAEIKALAKDSFGVSFALDSFTLELSLLLKQLEFLEEQQQVVEDRITTLLPIDCLLLTVPGINHVLAAAIISEIGDIHRFKRSGQLVSYAGINPTVRQSGNFLGTKNRMSKKGSPYLRLALWQAAVVGIRYNPVLKSFYEQKVSQGKNRMAALGAVSRKLTGIIFAILRDQQPFEERLAFL